MVVDMQVSGHADPGGDQVASIPVFNPSLPGKVVPGLIPEPGNLVKAVA